MNSMSSGRSGIAAVEDMDKIAGGCRDSSSGGRRGHGFVVANSCGPLRAALRWIDRRFTRCWSAGAARHLDEATRPAGFLASGL